MQLFNGNCLEVMTTLRDQSVDMVMCDLPYGTTQNKWDSIIPLDFLWSQYQRLCRGVIVLTAAQPFTSALITSGIKLFKQELIWKKNVASNFLNVNRMHLARHESVLVFATGKLPYNPQYTEGKAYVAKRYGNDDTGDCYGSIAKRTTTVNEGKRSPISVLEFDRETGFHPTQKPVALMEYLIKTYSNPGMTILDNCMGSGTTGVACINTSRDFIGIELDPNYFAIASERILDAQVNRAVKQAEVLFG